MTALSDVRTRQSRPTGAGAPGGHRPLRHAARRRTQLLAIIALAVVLALAGPGVIGVASAEYSGPIVDAHSHVPNGTAIDAYVAAMKHHNVTKVLLLGVGGVQKHDEEWLAAAAKKHPDRVVVGLPLPDPTANGAARRLEHDLDRRRPKALGEVHIRQVSRKIDRSPADPAFVAVLEVAGRFGVPVVIHQELDDRAAAELEKALAAQRKATIVLAHAGEATPTRLAGLLARNPNLVADLSGMHFQRTPALATESGPLDPAWKALIEKMPDRFLIGIDVWAARLFEPTMLDRLMAWTRRILGELRPEVAERVAYRNAAALYRLE